jgi:hypothetical protein
MARRQYYYTDFDTIVPVSQNDWSDISGTDTEINNYLIDGMLWEQYVIGTVAAPAPVKILEGADFKQDDANAEGALWTPGGNFRGSPLMAIVGTTPAFYMQLQVQATDWSGALLKCGFCATAAATDPIQADTKTVADYTDKAWIGNHAGGAVDVYTQTAINNAGDVDTDTVINLTDGDVCKFKVLVSAAGVVTYALEIAATATPTTFTAQTLTTAAFTFDDGDYVVPKIYILTHTDTATLLEFNRFEWGLQ